MWSEPHIAGLLPLDTSYVPGHAKCWDGNTATSGENLTRPDLKASKENPSQHRKFRRFLIGEDGLVYEGRGWKVKGDHAGRAWNPISIGITFMGNYMERVPPPRAIRAAQSLLACGVAQGALMPNYEVKGHRDVQQTLSPGDRLYELIQEWPQYRG
ncbi:peptidoglycan recognition protein 1 isoform X2 [Molossus molossus]|uniref:peptidoglycan recognition protein 1 isoform X2 n=1 Tax=Molossus molossus TaxID=27622 RepID=UPI00174659AF|nr:peptidoglycan recognition protein 1 isoform X2 [Molossus molossus]